MRRAAVACLLILAVAGTLLPQPLPLAEEVKLLRERNQHLLAFRALDGQGKLDEAVAAMEKALAIQFRLYGKVHRDNAVGLDLLGDVQMRRKDYAAAQKVYVELAEMWAKLPGTKAWKAADARLLAAYAARLAALPADKRKAIERAEALNEEAVAQFRAGAMKKAAGTGRAAVKAFTDAVGADHPKTANALGNLAIILHLQGDFAAAREPARESLRVAKKVHGDDHPVTGDALNRLGRIARDAGEYVEAQAYYEQALQVRTSALGANDVETAKSHNDLGDVAELRGDFDRAREQYGRALAALKASVGPNDRSTAAALNNLGHLAQTLGDYPAARSYYEQSLAIRRKLPGGVAHPDTAATVNNLATLLSAQGDFEAARRLLEQTLEVFEKHYGDDHPKVAIVLMNLGVQLEGQFKYAEAQALYERALRIRMDRRGPDHPDVAGVLNNLSSVLFARGEAAEAEAKARRALAIDRKAYGDRHPLTASTRNNLATAVRYQGRLDEALKLYAEALAVQEELLGKAHPSTTNTLHNLGAARHARGDFAEARAALERALADTRRLLDLTAGAQSEVLQLTMARHLRWHLDTYLSLAADAKIPRADLYAAVLAWKGTVLQRQRLLRARRDEPALASLIAELQTVSNQLANLALAVPDPKRADEHRKELAALAEKKDALERDLAGRSAAFRSERDQAAIDPTMLAQALPADVALVDFLEYDHTTLDAQNKGHYSQERRLLAFVVRPGKEIQKHDLGPAVVVADTVRAWRKQELKRGTAAKGSAGAELRKLVWEPLEPALTGAKTVLTAPDGALAALPFAALPGKQPGTYLIEERAIATVPVPPLVPRWLKDELPPSDGAAGLLLVGDVDFGGGPGRNDLPGTLLTWQPLPATRGEVKAVRGAFEKRFADGKVTLLDGAKATEAAVRGAAPKHRWLHLATHGFFAPPQMRSALAGKAGPTLPTGFHPGLLSGLALAGANRAAESGRDDGILTAIEVNALDLRPVELATLSACETGLGEVAGGEGLLGLQRAFQVAGARAVVASLWSVPDDATRVLMSRFYAGLWQKDSPRSKLDALRSAQLWMLREGRANPDVARGFEADAPPAAGKDGRLPPYYWAAFVLSGDWR